jgi:hypothetical protein
MSSYGKPPIVDALKILKEIKVEIAELKMEVIHIKNYIRKEEIRKLAAEEREKEMLAKEKEYVKTGWFY